VRIFLILIILPALLWAEDQPTADPWAMLHFLEGQWIGEVTGKAGMGEGERTYSCILQDRYFHFSNKATFASQEKNPEGEVHEDWGIYSYDKIRDLLVLRQFHVEGFVNQYVLDTLESNDSTVVFVTEAIENIPSGWRAKLILTRISNDEFVEGFQLASPGKDFGTCIENRWTRKKSNP